MVYDDDPNIDKYAHDFSRLSVSDIDSIKEALGITSGSSVVLLTNQTLSSASWTLVGDYYTYTFSNQNITATSIVDFTPNTASSNEVTSCEMQPQITAASGSCTFFSLLPPQANITGDITILST
jgi:uridylate kinase